MRKKAFKAESKRLLDLMINSIYTHKEIFLREIISNASDAIDKLCYLSLTDDQVGVKREDFGIRLTIDKENRLLTVSDNGIGMDEKELENNLGVIANSGTFQFRQEAGDEASDAIGQFGVGFYSAFMVADHISVITRKYGEAQGHRWESDGADGYTISECEKACVGTDIVMHLKADTEEEPNEYSRYLEEHTISALIRKYSDYIRFPIRMLMTTSRRKEGSPDDKPEYEDVQEERVLNSMVPLWQKKKADVKQEEYDQFYQNTFGDYTAPQSVITASVEGAVTYKALLFIPSRPPMKYYSEDYESGLQLYSAGVMIMDKCADLIPSCFNFVRGVVESPDLSLNISRELLQHDRQLKIIAGNLEKKIKNELVKLSRDDRAGYEQFWKNFGRQIKVGVLENYGQKKEELQDLLLFYSSTEKKLVTLAEYVSRMSEKQQYIYYVTGETIAAADQLPQIELLKEQHYEILYMTEQADPFVVEVLRSYQEKEFRSAADDDLGLEDVKKPEEAESDKETFAFIKEALGDKVDEVRASAKLKSHPVCLSSGEGMTFEMEKYFQAVQPEMAMKAKRILEVNTAHPMYLSLSAMRLTDPERAKKVVSVLMHQAQLIAGLPVEDASEYTDLLCSLLQ